MKSMLSSWLFLLAAVPVIAADAPPDRMARVENGLRPDFTIEGDTPWTLEERMQHYGVPAVSIAVIQDFKVVAYRVYGLADRETGEKATADTLFQAGSVSKPVAAFGALKMVANGELTLDGNVNDTMKSWALPDNEFTKEAKVTLTHLLAHTGGLTVHGFPGYAVGEDVPTTIQVLDGSGPANTPPVRVNKVPGEGYRYSGGGYTIAQLMMVDAAGKPFPAVMDELVFGPVGMERSTFLNPLPPKLLKHAAAGYLRDHSAVEGKRHTYPEMAAAGLWTTAEDLARFASEVQLALHGKSDVLDRATAEKLVEPVTDRYGRGFQLHWRERSRYFGHGGWDAGFCASLIAHRRAGYGAVVMINSNHPQLAVEIIRGIGEEYGWAGYAPHPKLGGLGMAERELYEPAIGLLRIATELYPDSANTYNSAGYVYRQMGQHDLAMTWYRKALDVDPDFPSALKAVAELQSEHTAREHEKTSRASSWRLGLTIRVWIDGSVLVKVREDKVWFEHISHALPGTWVTDTDHTGNEPTVVNGVEWIPEWDGRISNAYTVEGGIWPLDVWFVASHVISARGRVFVVEQASEDNDFTFTLMLDDDQQPGAAWYEVELRW